MEMDVAIGVRLREKKEAAMIPVSAAAERSIKSAAESSGWAICHSPGGLYGESSRYGHCDPPVYEISNLQQLVGEIPRGHCPGEVSG